MGATLLDGVWAFLKDPSNRDVLTWIGGGIVVVAGGVWEIVKFFAGRRDSGGSKPGVSAQNKSVASINNQINIGLNEEGIRRILQQELAEIAKAKEVPEAPLRAILVWAMLETYTYRNSMCERIYVGRPAAEAVATEVALCRAERGASAQQSIA